MVTGVVAHDEQAISHLNEKESSPTVPRFFKIMFGEDSPEVLYLPPEFAQTVEHLDDQEVEIEDSCGRRWSVTLSSVDGSLAFHEGWKKFHIDHNMEEGEVLVFSYTEGSHFSVQIYGLSACERSKFKYDRPRPPQQKERFERCETEVELTNVDIERAQLHTTPTSMEEAICMKKHGENEDEKVEIGRVWYGLSIFEMEKEAPQCRNRCRKDLAVLVPEIAILHPEIIAYGNESGHGRAGMAERESIRRYRDASKMACEYSSDVKDIGKMVSHSHSESDIHRREQPKAKRLRTKRDVGSKRN